MILEICYCGHAKETHFEHKHTCLGMLCDCTSYRDRDKPLPKRVAAKTFTHPDYVEDEEDCPITHRMDCTCFDCFMRRSLPP